MALVKADLFDLHTSMIDKNANQWQGGNSKPRVCKTMRFSCLLRRIKAKRHIRAITMYATFKRIKTGRVV
jgi:hypothetical protein